MYHDLFSSDCSSLMELDVHLDPNAVWETKLDVESNLNKRKMIVLYQYSLHEMEKRYDVYIYINYFWIVLCNYMLEMIYLI